jgi:hypothetical protein
MAENKVLLAESDVTVHVLFAPNAEPEVDQFGRSLFAVESRVLRAGETVDADMVPPYVLEAVKAEKAAGLKLMSASQAEKVVADAARLRALAAGNAQDMYAAGWDGSHSDHLVPDSVRMANLRAEGEVDAEVNPDDSGGRSGQLPEAAVEAAEADDSDAHKVVEADPSADSSDLAAVAVGDEAKDAESASKSK